MSVSAGPGSDETRLLTHRVGYIFRERDSERLQSPGTHLANKAAQKMVERRRTVPGLGRDGAFIGTFHPLVSVCLWCSLHCPSPLVHLNPPFHQAIGLYRKRSGYPESEQRKARQLGTVVLLIGLSSIAELNEILFLSVLSKGI